jgi:hypothetical protein
MMAAIYARQSPVEATNWLRRQLEGLGGGGGR